MIDTAKTPFSIKALNRASVPEALDMMDRIVERSDWLAARAVTARPFADAPSLALWLEREVTGLPRQDAILLLQAHPELAPAVPSAMTHASQSEQSRMSLLNPTPALAEKLATLNAAYRAKHGFPFVIALIAQPDMEAVLAQFESRLAADTKEELPRSLREVVSVMKARLARLTGDASVAQGRAAPAETSAHITGDTLS
ncbi:2-oxo-4-hydroxy-4-carboxy-5-ureidoimidazoline decarboxylase [Pseudooceanicola sp. C21-150M6]|uniref:2-oxo-4-hydroxy-4-carboxy-5-ureidoimidazoline decarboxylase n=1 Tax=Pseudooceanicola sp. C21-150M6 TaxID=3434355 RepID=UPI003D7F2BD2